MTDRLIGLALVPWWLATVASTAVAVAPLLIVTEMSRRLPCMTAPTGDPR